MRSSSVVVAAFLGLVGLWVVGSAPAQAQGAQLFAVLLGGNEVSPTGAAGAGDPNGNGAAAVIFRGNDEICVTLVVTGIDTPTAAHIHQEVAGKNGGIVVTLTTPSAGNPGFSNGCHPIDSALARQIRSRPSEFYINVHNGDFPGGALRGQLF